MSLNITETVKTSWRLIHGNKLPVFLAVLMMRLILMMLSQPMLGLVSDLKLIPEIGNEQNHTMILLFNGVFLWLVAAVLSVFYAGFIEIGVKRVKGDVISPFEVLLHTHHWLVVTNILMVFLVILLFSFGFLPTYQVIAIYFLLASVLIVALPVATCCDTNTFHALYAGITIGFKHIMKILSLIMILIIASLGAIVTLGIGLLWLIPFKLHMIGCIYTTFENQGLLTSFKQKDRYLIGEILLSLIFVFLGGYASLQNPHHPAEFLTGLSKPQTKTGLTGHVIELKR